MKKLLVVVIVVLFIGMSVSTSTGFNVVKQSYNPTYNRNILYVGGSGTNNYTKIQDALDNATDGDTVFVYDDSSPYNEIIVIRKPIKVIGENKDTTIIDGGGVGKVVNIVSDNVTFKGFNVKNGVWDATIYICADYTLVSDNIVIHGAKSYGIRLVLGDYNIITNNTLENRFIGIKLGGPCANNVISYNDISNCGYGIFLNWGAPDPIIFNNVIIGNNVSSCSKHGISLGIADNNIISKNIISNSDVGIHFVEADNNKILENIIIGNNRGIVFWNENLNNEIYRNNIRDNAVYGFLVEPRSWSISFNCINNNFKNNGCHAYFSDKRLGYPQKWKRNYWDDWIGIGPYCIRGTKVILINNVKKWVQFDWFPKYLPYSIINVEDLSDHV